VDCAVDGCVSKHKARGWCEAHYQRWRRYGSPTGSAVRTDPLKRFWDKVNKDGPVHPRLSTQCWMWTGSCSGSYGVILVRGKYIRAHRFSYSQVASLSEDEEIDHICHNVLCVNPDHLRPCTRKQNAENRSGLQRNNVSGVQGVRWDSSRNLWVAVVQHYGRRHFVGRFKSLEFAERAVLETRNKLFTFNDRDREPVA